MRTRKPDRPSLEDYAADPGDYVREHGLERGTDADIVNHEAGKSSKKGF